MSYTIWQEKILELPSENPDQFYGKGFIFGRKEVGYIYETRSLRIDLKQFSLSSENRRILKKRPLELKVVELPLSTEDYNWKYHKIGSDFYSTKFPDAKFSANKIKQILTNLYNFNKLYIFYEGRKEVGYLIAYQAQSPEGKFFHYCYPFYDLNLDTNNLGMAMMLTTIITSRTHGLEYIYLGGATRQADKYKLQFNGLEWWDGNLWRNDIQELKNIISREDK